LDALHSACLGRSHRSAAGKAKLEEALRRSRAILGLPEDYRIALVPGSDTGAVEMCLWSMLGQRGIDVFAWESFGLDWVKDVIDQLKLEAARIFKADYGALPDLTQADFDNDIVFTWNGTTSGVKVPDGDWIDPARRGLTICDATSAIFAMPLPWDKLDVITYSWQKVLGGEAAHGMVILSPRAAARLQSYTPPWPLPKLFRMSKGGKLDEALFAGSTINTPSMLAVEDYLRCLNWAEASGGLTGLIARSEVNLAVIEDWVERTPWIDFLASRPEIRSNTSVCLKIIDPEFQRLSGEQQAAASKALAGRLEQEGVAFDINGYRNAPPGLRIWAGATVEQVDLEALLPWLDWAYATRT
jgi:phosphoserine aminotransferase